MAEFPQLRLRRLRRTEALRKMFLETGLHVSDLVYPLFAVPGKGVKQEIPSLPGNYHLSSDQLAREAEARAKLGIPAVLVFGLPSDKDERGSGAYDKQGVVQSAVREMKQAVPELVVITDVCLCQYTDHGHCGVVVDGSVDNDKTLELLARTALSHAKAGADIVAPSDMMDGRVAAIRGELDANGFQEAIIMSYAAKYASAFYGPFREAAESTPSFGDRCSYQLDPANVRQAMLEVEQDVREGADMILIKPALAYLDVIHRVRERYDLPVAAYNVSGEYAMVKAASRMGWLDESACVRELLTAIKRAGADIIITYHAKEVAGWLRSSRET
ncbi:MAG: porphobilinogen synthase [Dehalococcoidia bacterium]|nr:MAG: porphobilinogen synthase [Dehalococcoidia bacterium]